MASSYTLPSSALPHAHQHHISGSHSSSHSQSSLNSWRASMSGDRLSASFEDAIYEEGPAATHGHSHSHSHDHGHDHSHSHDHSHELRTPRQPSHHRMGSYASNTSASISKERPPSMNLEVMDGWTLERTVSGKSVVTPGLNSASTPYSPPRLVNKAQFNIDENNQRSFFTNALLPYTAKYPILHAIMTEKDSRRIFYFMTYVSRWNIS